MRGDVYIRNHEWNGLASVYADFLADKGREDEADHVRRLITQPSWNAYTQALVRGKHRDVTRSLLTAWMTALRHPWDQISRNPPEITGPYTHGSADHVMPDESQYVHVHDAQGPPRLILAFGTKIGHDDTITPGRYTAQWSTPIADRSLQANYDLLSVAGRGGLHSFPGMHEATTRQLALAHQRLANAAHDAAFPLTIPGTPGADEHGPDDPNYNRHI